MGSDKTHKKEQTGTATKIFCHIRSDLVNLPSSIRKDFGSVIVYLLRSLRSSITAVTDPPEEAEAVLTRADLQFR